MPENLNMEACDAVSVMQDLYHKLDEGIQDIQEGRVVDVEEAMKERRVRYGLLRH